MANQLDEMNAEIMEEGREVHVIAKVIPVKAGGTEKMIPYVIMAIGVIVILAGFLNENYIMAGVGVLVAVFP